MQVLNLTSRNAALVQLPLVVVEIEAVAAEVVTDSQEAVAVVAMEAA